MSATHGKECKITRGHCYRDDCDDDKCCWSNRILESLYALTKGADLKELKDYDTEIAANVREARAKAHEIMFGPPK